MSELVQKWSMSGFLHGVKQQNLQRVAERLEAAQRAQITYQRNDLLDKELSALEREGMFGRKSR